MINKIITYTQYDTGILLLGTDFTPIWISNMVVVAWVEWQRVGTEKVTPVVLCSALLGIL